jgi:hypothetical protein
MKLLHGGPEAGRSDGRRCQQDTSLTTQAERARSRVQVIVYRRVRSGMVAMRAKDMRAKERNE